MIKKLLPICLFLGLLQLTGCRTESETTFWDNIVLNTDRHSVAFMFTSSVIPPAGDYGLPVMEEMKNGSVAGLDGDKMFYMSLYPNVLDPLYSPFAENFLFEYDESGDDSFTTYPAFVANLENFNYELDSFQQKIIDHQKEFAPIQVGTLLRAQGSQLSIYVKTQYLLPHSAKHSVAVYVYEKQKVGSQETIENGTVSNFIHKNVLVAFVNGMYGEEIDESFSMMDKKELEYTYDLGSLTVENAGVLTVVYEMDASGNPIGIHNAYSN